MTLNTSNYIKIFQCEYCDFKCSKKGDWNRHIMTPKHKIMTLNDKNTSKNINTFECKCGKIYKHRQNLHTHKKTCSMFQCKPEALITNLPITNIVDIENISELFKHMLTQNQEFMKDIVEKVIPNIGNTIHNTTSNNTNSHNTMNNHFNIQMFLNEHCKNAMNLTEFVQSLPITSETYDSTIDNGLTKTITNMMLNGLNELDILKRPIHCTDASRKTLYVKESDVWEKDNELQHVIDSIKYLSIKQRGMIKTWKEANEGWQENDKLQSRMTNLIINSMKLIERDDKEISKIVRSISKNVYLDNETKKLYM